MLRSLLGAVLLLVVVSVPTQAARLESGNSFTLSEEETQTGDLYFGGTESVLECLTDRDAALRILVAGHEPTWSELVAVLTGGGRVRMPTAAVACIDFAAASWSHLRPGTGQLQWVVTPKLLQRAMRGCSGDAEL